MFSKQNVEKIVGLFINAKYSKLIFMQNQVQRPLTKKEIEGLVSNLLDEFKELYQLFDTEESTDLDLSGEPNENQPELELKQFIGDDESKESESRLYEVSNN